ncbi:MAG: sugar phosphate nucleotidyltransferase [Candidatus Aminicenantales bacterium]
MSNISLLVLAAGIGRRYRGLKQVDPIGPAGETMLDYSLYGALRSGISQVTFVIRREIERLFRQAVGGYWERHFEVSYIFQEAQAGLPKGFSVPLKRSKPWGTAHAVLISRMALTTPFATINADDFYGPSAFRDLSDWLKKNPFSTGSRDEYAFVGYRLRNTLSDHGYVSRGVCRIDADGYLAEVVERVRVEKDGPGARALDEHESWVSLTGEEVVSMNFWGFQPAIFSHLEKAFIEFLERSGKDPQAEYFIPSVVNALLRAGRIRVKYIPTEEPWFGITYPEDLPRVRRHVRELIREGVFPAAVRGEGSRT